LFFVRQVLPRVWKQMPEATFTVIGRNPTRQIRALANDARIVVTGTVEDVRPLLAAQSVIVCPILEAGGIKNKMLETLAMGKAVVATPHAAEGLELEDGVQALLRGDATALADACLCALRDETSRTQLGAAARAWALEHTWRACAETYIRYYGEARNAFGA
jgi:glycosyltransferase involved in cell wall biosynthesis